MQKGITRTYNVRAIPTTFFIGQDGIIREIKLGAFSSESELEQALNTVMEYSHGIDGELETWLDSKQTVKV